MKRYSHLFEQVVDMDNLKLALQKAKNGKMRLEKTREVVAKADYYLPLLQKMLIEGTFKTSKYKTKIIREPKERLIYVLTFFPDRIVHHAIMNILEPIWEKQMIEHSFACRKGKGQHKGSALCIKYTKAYKWCLKCDISKFYPSINHEVLKKIVRNKIKDKKLLWLLDDIIDSIEGESNLPIGNYISQWLGNLYLNELDKWILEDQKLPKYIRYCDDFVVFSNDKSRLLKLQRTLPQYLHDTLRLRMSKNTLLSTAQGINFLGCRHFHSGKILLRKSTARKIRKVIRKGIVKLATLDNKSWKGYRTLQNYHGKMMSYKGWLSFANTHNFEATTRFTLVTDYFQTEFLKISKGGYSMKGFPKHLNTKADYEYIRRASPESQWKPCWQALLDSAYDWFTVFELESKEIGEEIEGKARVLTETDNATGKERYFQSYMQMNPNCRLLKLGFTEDEVKKVLGIKDESERVVTR